MNYAVYDHSATLDRREGKMWLIGLYWFLAIAGFGFFAITFVLGELFDFGSDALDGVSDAIGGAIDAVEGVFSGADAADVDFSIPDIGDVDVDVGPSPFSFRTIVIFLSGFGAGGLVGDGLGLSLAATLIPAFGTGAVLGFGAFQFYRFLYRQQGGTSVQPLDYVGLIGRVTTSIPRNGLGQVMIDIKLQKKNMPARSEDGLAIRSQTQIHVVSMEGGVLIVEKLN